MNSIIKKLSVICLVFLCALLPCACSEVTITPAADQGGIYSRENTEYMSSKANFGHGRDDGIYVALKYVYENQSLIDKYGTSFEVNEKNSGGSSEIQTFMVMQIYKGSGQYFFCIDNDEWILEFSKGYFGKWEVTNCYMENE